MSRKKKSLIAGVGVVAILVGTATAVYASAENDTDHFSRPAGTVVKGALKTGTVIKFTGSINGIPITVKCTHFAASGPLPASGLTATLSAPPTVSGCTDSLGGTDTVATNQTNGPWLLQGIDKPLDEGLAEPNATGDKASLIIPKAGATFKSNAVSACVITAAPSGPAPVTGTFNDSNTIIVNGASIPTSGSGCTSTNAKTYSTVIISPTIHDV